MDYTYELLGLSDHAHVAARFLVAHWPFPGISSADEIEFVLKSYDEASEWSAQSGISYLAHFAPDAYARGARLAPCAGVLWRVLDSLLPSNYKGDAEYPMQHITRAIEEIMIDVARGEKYSVLPSQFQSLCLGAVKVGSLGQNIFDSNTMWTDLRSRLSGHEKGPFRGLFQRTTMSLQTFTSWQRA